MEEEKNLLLEATRLKAERLEEENKDLVFRVASAEIHANSVRQTADKMKEHLDDAAELMRRYDVLLGRLLELNKKMKEWLRY